MSPRKKATKKKGSEPDEFDIEGIKEQLLKIAKKEGKIGKHQT